MSNLERFAPSLQPYVEKAVVCAEKKEGDPENCYQRHVAARPEVRALNPKEQELVTTKAEEMANNKVRIIVDRKIDELKQAQTKAQEAFIKDPSPANRESLRRVQEDISVYSTPLYLKKIKEEKYPTLYAEALEFYTNNIIATHKKDIMLEINPPPAPPPPEKWEWRAFTAGTTYTTLGREWMGQYNYIGGKRSDVWKGQIELNLKMWMRLDELSGPKNIDRSKYFDTFPLGFTVGPKVVGGLCLNGDPHYCLDAGAGLGIDPIRGFLYGLIAFLPFGQIYGASGFVSQFEGSADLGLQIWHFNVRAGIYPTSLSLYNYGLTADGLQPGIRFSLTHDPAKKGFEDY